MNSFVFFLIFIPILGLILLNINFILAAHNPYKEKKTPFECGYHSFLAQNRTQFTISFFIFALLFLVFDLEIVLIYPYTVSNYFNGIYGIGPVLVFIIILTVGFQFELGNNALSIDTKQYRKLDSRLFETSKQFSKAKIFEKLHIIIFLIGTALIVAILWKLPVNCFINSFDLMLSDKWKSIIMGLVTCISSYLVISVRKCLQETNIIKSDWFFVIISGLAVGLCYHYVSSYLYYIIAVTSLLINSPNIIGIFIRDLILSKSESNIYMTNFTDNYQPGKRYSFSDDLKKHIFLTESSNSSSSKDPSHINPQETTYVASCDELDVGEGKGVKIVHHLGYHREVKYKPNNILYFLADKARLATSIYNKFDKLLSDDVLKMNSLTMEEKMFFLQFLKEELPDRYDHLLKTKNIDDSLKWSRIKKTSLLMTKLAEAKDNP